MAILLVVSCAESDDAFEARPNATVLPEQLQAMIDSVMTPLRFSGQLGEALPGEQPEDNRESCRGKNVWVNCRAHNPPAPSPGWASAYRNGAGAEIIVVLRTGRDALHAEDLMKARADGLSRTSTAMARRLSQPAEVGDTFASGPCNQGASRTSDDGCAWERREPPRVGDGARALQTNVIENEAGSFISFTRDFVFASVKVSVPDIDDPGIANQLAGRVAALLDEELMRVLSQ